MKLVTTLAIIFTSLMAHSKVQVSAEKHIGGRYLTRITSLSVDKTRSKELVMANPQDGYHIEIEREVEGFAGPVLESDIFQSKLKVGLGIEATAGFTFTNSKDVKNKAELESFSNNKAIEYFKVSKALKMEANEKAHFDFFAGIVLAPEISNFGVWAVATGGWDVGVTKTENDKVEIEFSLIDSKMASFYFDKFATMISYDIGRELETGYVLELNLKNPKAREAYERLFKGNVLFAQQESLKNKDIVFKQQSFEKKFRRGTGIWSRSPLVAWFLFNSTHHLVSGEKIETTLEENKHDEKTISASYEEESSLDFLSTYHGKERKFEVGYNVESKEFEMEDIYELESNVGADFGISLNQMLMKTQMDQFFDRKVSRSPNKFYHLKFDVKYNEDVLKHIVSGRFQFGAIQTIANKKLEEKYNKDLEFAFNAKLDPTAILAAKQFDRQLIYINLNKVKNEALNISQSLSNNNMKVALDAYARLMKATYKSSFLYNAYVEYTKHCGTEVSFEMESEAFAKKTFTQKYLKDKVCE